MKLVVTIDVEEEGLFSGKYQSTDPPTDNVAFLPVLDRVFRDLAIRPTLLITYQVARHPANRDLLAGLASQWNGELGAHLHHWNTPPLEPLPYPEPVCSELIPKPLLSAKLNTLLDTLRVMGAEPVSFRMGRFNLGPRMLSVLDASPIMVDSSVAPMRQDKGGPAHLEAPTDPYHPDPECPARAGSSRILEVPMTILPLVPGLGRVLAGLLRHAPSLETPVSNLARYLLSLPVQPLWTGERRLKTAVRVHQSRGGRVLSVFFHSSELMPGGCPQHKSEQDVMLFVEKLRRFFMWLTKDVGVEPVTLAEMGNV